MKPYVYYDIWNKESHIAWILDGIEKFVPRNSFIDFTFEDLQDDSEIQFNINKAKFLRDFKYRQEVISDKYRFKNVNNAIRRFMASDCDFFISPQDDQKIQDSRLIGNIEFLYKSIPNIGLIGLRDAISESGFKVVASSHFSSKEANTERQWLASGEYIAADIVNDGALILNKNTVNKVGLFDDVNFAAFYIEYDYCLRCKKEGLVNYLLGAELVHEKFGKILPSELYDGKYNYAMKDLAALANKRQIYGY